MNSAIEPDQKRAFYLKILLNSRHKGSQEPLLKLIPGPLSKSLSQQKTQEKNLSALALRPEPFLSQIHYSWLAEILQNLPEGQRGLYAALFPPSSQSGLIKLLNLSSQPPEIEKPLKAFLQKKLVETVLPEDYLDLAYLPKTELSVLTTLSKAKLVSLLDFLGLFDLAEELKKIINTETIRSVFLALSPLQQAFLRTCLHQKDLLQTPRFPLKEWSGTSSELQSLIHKRGLIRFAKALSGQPKPFLWHLTRKLDIGRGKRIESLLTKEEPPQVAAIMTAQVLQVLNFIEKGSS